MRIKFLLALLPLGVVPYGYKPVQKPAITVELLQRGQERYEIYCAVCHGSTGDGDGMATTRGFPRPPSFHIPALRSAPPEFIFQVGRDGRGDMLGYKDRVPPEDLWAITAYIRALQKSRDTRFSELTPEEQKKVGGGS